jgi:hypothetical protein
MPSTVRASFQEFSGRLEPTEMQKSDAATKQSGVRDCLNARLSIDSSFLTGSYARRTIIRPPDDIDLFVVLDYPEHGRDYYLAYDSAQKILKRFHAILKDYYPGTPIRKDHPAVHLTFATYGLDVVPAFRRNGGGYMIPSHTKAGWIPTDPTKHAERTSAMNRTTGGYFVPLVKMFKSWNRANFYKLTGFHLEMGLADTWPTMQSLIYPYSAQHVIYSSYAEGAAALFSALSTKLQYYTSDPAGMSGNIDDYLAFEDRSSTRQRLTRADEAAQIALRHEARGDHYAAINKWRDIFGDPFPAYS